MDKKLPPKKLKSNPNAYADLAKFIIDGASSRKSEDKSVCQMCAGHGLIGGWSGGVEGGYESEDCPACTYDHLETPWGEITGPKLALTYINKLINRDSHEISDKNGI